MRLDHKKAIIYSKLNNFRTISLNMYDFKWLLILLDDLKLYFYHESREESDQHLKFSYNINKLSTKHAISKNREFEKCPLRSVIYRVIDVHRMLGDQMER